jgi:hypothetical protein
MVDRHRSPYDAAGRLAPLVGLPADNEFTLGRATTQYRRFGTALARSRLNPAWTFRARTGLPQGSVHVRFRRAHSLAG